MAVPGEIAPEYWPKLWLLFILLKNKVPRTITIFNYSQIKLAQILTN